MHAQSDINFMLEMNELKPVKRPEPLISKYCEEHRILPSNTPFPGKFHNSRTPYAVEIMDNMSPFSPIQHTAIMKGVQVGFTTAAENIVAYWMDESPSEILYVSATVGMLEKWAIKSLEPLIDSCGYRHKIFAQTENKNSRRTGDKVLIKEYAGGSLDMASAQSASSLRAASKRILIRDEVDGAPPMLKTGEGHWLDVSLARTSAWGSRKKILDISTPTTIEASEINRMYGFGDCRKYLVPCPCCGKYQELRFGTEKTKYGIKVEKQGGLVIKAHYSCEFCHEAIFNHQKTKMFNAGRWEPTKKSSDPVFRSYHLSSLYSPNGMTSWTDLYKKYEEALNKPEGMRAFSNLYLGEPYLEEGSRPVIEDVINLRGGYQEKEVPDGVLYLVCGIDVQRGSENDRRNPARLELEIMGMGSKYRTWSILYKSIEGSTENPEAGAWAKLNKWAKDGGLNFKRSDGTDIPVSLTFIDSGDGQWSHVVYRFTENWQNTYPSKGFGELKTRKKEGLDEVTRSNIKRYRPIKVRENMTLYEISTNYYKAHLYNNLKVKRIKGEEQKAGFCDFPVGRSKHYFEMLTAEEKRASGAFYLPSGKRNEALDCRIMCICAADVYLEAIVMEMKAHYKTQGADEYALTKIDYPFVIKYLEDKFAQ